MPSDLHTNLKLPRGRARVGHEAERSWVGEPFGAQEVLGNGLERRANPRGLRRNWLVSGAGSALAEDGQWPTRPTAVADTPRGASCLQLLLQLVEEAPVRAL